MAAVATVAVGLGAASYFLGLWHRPKFSFSTLLKEKDEEWFAIVATCREKKIAKFFLKLMNGTKRGIDSLSNGSNLLKEGCKAYVGDGASDSLNVGLYFDDPNTAEHPRWCVGYAVRGTPSDPLTVDSLKMICEKVQKESGFNKEEHEIRAVRLSGSLPVYRGSIPWMSSFTPMIAPMIHWKRAFQSFEKEGGKYPELGPIAMEVYVCKNSEWFESYIDYNIVHGENSSVWNDVFP